MLSQVSITTLRKNGWNKNRHVNLKNLYPSVLQTNDLLSDKQFRGYKDVLSSFCGIEFKYDFPGFTPWCSLRLSPYSILGLDHLNQLSAILNTELIFIGEANESVPILMSKQGGVYIFVEDDKELICFENLYHMINSMVECKWKGLKKVDTSHFNL